MSATVQELRDEVADAIGDMETLTERIILALRRLERDHKLDLYIHQPSRGYARAAHEMIDMVAKLDAILDDIDQQLRERAQ